MNMIKFIAVCPYPLKGNISISYAEPPLLGMGAKLKVSCENLGCTHLLRCLK